MEGRREGVEEGEEEGGEGWWITLESYGELQLD